MKTNPTSALLSLPSSLSTSTVGQAGSSNASTRFAKPSFSEMYCRDFLTVSSSKLLPQLQVAMSLNSSRLTGEVAPVEPKKKTDLFSALVADPRALYFSALEDPDQFNPEATHLLEQLVNGTKQRSELTQDELTTLSTAVLDLTQYRKAPPTQARRIGELFDEEEIPHDEGDLVLEDGPATYWWRQ